MWSFVKRRRYWLGGSVVLLALVALAFFLARDSKVHFTQRQCNRIQAGMTRQEVEAVLGMPPGNYRTRPFTDGQDGAIAGCLFVALQGKQPIGFWLGDAGAIVVWFDERGIVTDKDYCPAKRPEDQSVIDRLRAWLGV